MAEFRPGGVILAAGESRRMGCPKPFLEFRGESFVARMTGGMKSIGAEPVVVVANPIHRELYEPLALRAEVVWNEKPELGMLVSLCLGLRALPSECTHVVFSPVDVPNLQSATWQAIADSVRSNPERKLVPEFHGKTGHPVVVPRWTMEELLTAGDDCSPRDIVLAPRGLLRVAVDDPGILVDVDVPSDFQRLHDIPPGTD